MRKSKFVETPGLYAASANPEITTPNAMEPIASSVRSKTVDIVKGIAIVLMVYGHTAQGMMHRGWWTGSRAVFSDTFVYSFHMPAFFFVAGLFVMSSLAKRGRWHFVADKLRTVLYPYLVFAVIVASIEPFIHQFKISKTELSFTKFIVYVVTGSAGWFLFTLFFCLMLAMLTAKIPAWLRLSVMAFAGLIPVFAPVILSQIVREFFFLAAGMSLGLSIFRLEKMKSATAIFFFVVLSAFQIAMCEIYKDPVVSGWVFMVLGLSGTAGIFFLAQSLDRSLPGDLLGWLGQASLAIFFLAEFAQGATREVLLKGFHTQNFWLQLLVPTFFAALLPAIVWHERDRWKVSWLFSSPI